MTTQEKIEKLNTLDVGSIVHADDGASYEKIPASTRSDSPWIGYTSNSGSWMASDGSVWAARDIAWFIEVK